MTPCDQCRDLVWDYVYGLLEADQTQTLCDHVAACGSCQTALTTAEAQRARLARAARLEVEVPLFLPPEPEPVSPAFPAPASEISARLPRRRWPWLAAAASVLLLVGLPYGVHQLGLSRQRLAVRELHARLTAVSREYAEAQEQARAEEDALRRRTRAGQLRLQVLGPASYQPGLSSQYQVRTTDWDGQLTPAHLTARLVAADGRVLFEAKELSSAGEQLVTLPPRLGLPPNSTARLEVIAQGREDREQVLEQLPVAQPAYATHLAVAQTVYRPGETVFFRSLTLDRFGHKPPEQSLLLEYTLRDAYGVVVQRLSSPLRADGIGGGQFPLSPDCTDGEYSVTVAEAEQRFPTRARRFWVSNAAPAQFRKTLQLDRPWYNPGDTLRGDFRALRMGDGGPVANQPLQISLTVDGRPIGTLLQVRTDAQGAVSVRYSLPGDLPAGTARLLVRIEDGGRAETLTQTVPLGAPRLEVEFFPEGGDLTAGVPNRVYFRVRTVEGKPVDLAGQVVDGQGREIAQVHTAGTEEQPNPMRGLGVFVFTPQAGETYQLRNTSPGQGAITASLPAVRPMGVALQVPASVTSEGEPIRVLVHSTEPERSLLLGLFAAGRLIAQQPVTVKPGGTEVKLVPATGLSGVLRVTAFDWQGEQLRPLAERLVYRVPATRLVLSVQTDKENYQAGERVQLTLRSSTEKGQPEPAWLLVSVANQAALEPAREWLEPGLPAYFSLATEVRHPEDLEQADFLVSGQPHAAAALDLFLGTQGWRRFRAPGADARLARTPAAPPPSRGTDETLLLQLDNQEQVQRKVLAAEAVALANLRSGTAARERELEEEAQRCDTAAHEASRALLASEERAQERLRQGAGLTSLLSLVAGCLLLTFAVVRVLRGVSANTPYFAGAFTSLLLCLVALYGLRSQGEDSGRSGWTVRDPLKPDENARLIVRTPRVASPPAAAPERVGAARPATPPRPRTLVRLEAEQTGEPERRLDPDRVRERLLALGPRDQGGSVSSGALMRAAAASPPAERAAISGMSRPKTGVRPDKAADEKPLKGKAPRADSPPAQALREYAYQLPRGEAGPAAEASGTLVWYPALFIADGTAQITFDLPRGAATYRILASGHGQSARLGVVQSQLEARPSPR